MREITIDDCLKLQSKFRAYCERAEQHEFPMLLIVDYKLAATIKKIDSGGTVAQSELRAMYRTVSHVTDSPVPPWAEEQEDEE